MSGSGLEPYRRAPDRPHAADGGFWDTASLDNEVWRYARQLAADAAREDDRAPRAARVRVAGKAAAAPPQAGPPSATTSARLLEAARGVGRVLLLVGAAAAGAAGGMSAGGGALPIDLRSWRPLVAQASPAAEAAAPATPAAPALAADGVLTATARAATTPALPPRAVIASVRATDWLTAELVDELILAATRRAIPAGAMERPDPPARTPAPAVIERPAAPWRVQLALLRNPRNAQPVWRGFVTRLGPLASGLERHVLPTRTRRGLRHLVQAGPFADADAAQAMCARVLAAGGDCLVVPPPS